LPTAESEAFVAKRRLVKPTEAELAILRVLWKRGPSTVREVTDELHRDRGTGYTTALKLLQIMTDKGLVRRNDSTRSHVYEASAPAETTQRQLVGDLLDKAFGGSAQRLVMQALTAKRASPDELAEIRRLLDRLEQQGGK
jgi:predicted transcriptional regulator